MATYVVTGASTLLGRLLIERLLDRQERTTVYALCRTDSLAALRERWMGEDRVVATPADLTEPGLATEGLPSAPEHVVVLSTTGTGNVLRYADEAGAGAVHVFTRSRGQEDVVQGAPPHTPALRVYRTSVIVGDARTGEAAGDSALFGMLARLARLGRIPTLGADLGETNLVPVDYVAAALAHVMHQPSEDADFHIAAPEPQRVTDVYNEFAAAAGAPRVVARAPRGLARGLGALAGSAVAAVDRVPLAGATRRAVAGELGMTSETFRALRTSVLRPNQAAARALAGSGLTVPEPRDYAGVLYRYWRRSLDPDRAARESAGRDLTGCRVLITGASSGIGRKTALRVAELGGVPLLVARREHELAGVAGEINAAGGRAASYPCDITDDESVDALVKRVLDEHGAVDVLVNNAGRSIRRSVADATDRLHDYERTMAVNYFAAVRLTLRLLPVMRERGHGHVVNITTQGIQNHTPRFSAYLASKAALEEFGLVAARENLSHGITFSSVKLPLVSTEMTAPSEELNAFAGIPFMGVDRARDLVIKAITRKPESVRVTWPAGRPAELASMLAPRTMRTLTHLVGYEASPERGTDGAQRRPVGIPAIAAGAARMLWRRLA